MTPRDKDLQTQTRAIALVRPEHIKVVSDLSKENNENKFWVVVEDTVYFGSSLRLFTYFEQSKEPLFFDITADTDLANQVKRWQRLMVGWAKDLTLCYKAD